MWVDRSFRSRWRHDTGADAGAASPLAGWATAARRSARLRCSPSAWRATASRSIRPRAACCMRPATARCSLKAAGMRSRSSPRRHRHPDARRHRHGGAQGRGLRATGSGRAPRARGRAVARFDLDRLARRAPSLVTPLLVTNAGSFEILRRASGQSVEQGDFLMEMRVTGAGRAAVRGDQGAAHQRRMRVPFQHGLHARPAGQLVQALRGFDAQVTLRAHGRQASAQHGGADVAGRTT